MDAVFLNLVNISITASYIATAVILFRLFLKKAPKAYTCILWLLVAFRLILPFSNSNMFIFSSIFSLIPSTEVLPNNLIDNASPQFNINIGIEQIDKQINALLDDRYYEGVKVPANNGSNLMNILGMIWMIVFLAIIIYAVASYIYFRRKTKASIRVKGNTFICDYISTPFILGVIKPKILLPSTLTEKERKYVLAHERAHLRRLDHLWKPIGFILLSVHWFNPIMWLAYILFCRDIELACDEYVIKQLSSDDKKAYSTALLNCSIQKKLVSAYPLAFGEIGVKERIKTILKYKKPAVITSIIAVLLCIITALCFLANPKKTSLTEEIGELPISDIYSIDFDDGNIFSTTENENYIETIMNELDEIVMGRIPFKSTNFNAEYKTITIYPKESNFYYDIDSKYYEQYDKHWELHFNFEYDEVWIGNGENSTEVYKVYNPEKVLQLFESIEQNNDIESNPYKKYLYLDNEKEVISPCLMLYENKMSFSFTYSILSSTFCAGNYEIKNNKIMLESYGGNFYAFEITENGLIFDAENSTELPEYKYSSNDDAEAPVPDGAFFELTNG